MFVSVCVCVCTCLGLVPATGMRGERQKSLPIKSLLIEIRTSVCRRAKYRLKFTRFCTHNTMCNKHYTSMLTTITNEYLHGLQGVVHLREHVCVRETERESVCVKAASLAGRNQKDVL